MYLPGIEAFLAIVQTENLTKAADVLHLTQSTISYRLKILEQEMNVQLVERRKGISKVRLTATGENFVKLAERWHTLSRETQILQTTGAQLSLLISAANSLNIYVLPPLYRAISQHPQSIRLIIKTEHTKDSLDSVECKDVDVAFVVREIETSPSILIDSFFLEDMVLLRLASPDRITMDFVDIKSLLPENELFMNWGTGYQFWHDKWWDPICPSRIIVDEAALIPELLQNSKQWAIVSRSAGNRLSQTGNYVIQQLSEPAPNRSCYRLMHKYPNQATSHMLGILDEYIRVIYNHQ